MTVAVPMLRLIRFLISLVVIAAVVYFVFAVPLGKKTLWQHLKAIAGSKEGQELVDEVKQKAGSVVRRDAGARKVADDKLSDQERKLLRKLIREKLGADAGK
jgi:uncharacterized membrane protein